MQLVDLMTCLSDNYLYYKKDKKPIDYMGGQHLDIELLCTIFLCEDLLCTYL